MRSPTTWPREPATFVVSSARTSLKYVPRHLDFEPGVRDEILQREVGQIGVEIERSFAAFPQLDFVHARFERVADQRRLVVEGEQILRVDRDLFDLFAVDVDFDRHLRPIFAAGDDVLGQGLDRDGRVAGAVPIGRVLAVVEQVLGQPRRLFGLRIGPREELQVVGVGLGFAVVPEPPERAFGQLEPGGLVLVVLDQVLVDVPHDHRQAIGGLHLREGQAEQALGVDRKPGPVAIEKVLHLLVVHVRLDEHAVDQGVDVVGVRFVRIDRLARVCRS